VQLALRELSKLDTTKLVNQRRDKYLSMGSYTTTKSK
jgi:acetyl-CoA carboxylase alpha subunit